MKLKILAPLMFGLSFAPAGAGSLFGSVNERHKSLLEGRLAEQYAGLPLEAAE
mgnify:CR=1 FL=1